MTQRGFSSDLVRASTDLVVLSLLGRRPMYGYEILVSLAERGTGEFRLKQGTLYPVLYRLEREGWVRGRDTTSPEGKRRKVYGLTAEGRRTHARLLEDWQRFTHAVRSILEEDHA